MDIDHFESCTTMDEVMNIIKCCSLVNKGEGKQSHINHICPTIMDYVLKNLSYTLPVFTSQIGHHSIIYKLSVFASFPPTFSPDENATF